MIIFTSPSSAFYAIRNWILRLLRATDSAAVQQVAATQWPNNQNLIEPPSNQSDSQPANQPASAGEKLSLTFAASPANDYKTEKKRENKT